MSIKNKNNTAELLNESLFWSQRTCLISNSHLLCSFAAPFFQIFIFTFVLGKHSSAVLFFKLISARYLASFNFYAGNRWYRPFWTSFNFPFQVFKIMLCMSFWNSYLPWSFAAHILIFTLIRGKHTSAVHFLFILSSAIYLSKRLCW